MAACLGGTISRKMVYDARLCCHFRKAQTPALHAASYVDYDKRDAQFSVFYACPLGSP